ncbi:MAG: hypothetical protein JRG97_03495 [Deltaproteobacteria bacterium]|nr:hypothetical protein [Deltaproteobacteria bacterium]MBW2053221.1 hypothetical protein [Deltaproteobacteria bacterium]MBW2140122.1 hypothetical protein [Deltaproteobacteria bacterium]MBW2323507.1 hypothetical protein [Deltaproteobacteria bacterium]
MDRAQVKFGEWIERGFSLYKENFGLLVLAALVALVVSLVTVGLLAGPMLAGLALITLALYDKKEPKPELRNIFRGFDYFLNAFLFILVWFLIILVISAVLNVVPVIGQLASIVFSLAAQTLLMFGLYLIVDEQMGFWSASQESISMVRTNFWPFFGLFLVSEIIGSIGAIACGIGVIFTAPIQFCILTVAYRDVFHESRDSDADWNASPGETEEDGPAL